MTSSMLYVPAPGGYRILVGGRWQADVFEGKSAWWLVTDSKVFRHVTLRELEARVAAAVGAAAMRTPAAAIPTVTA
jgi:hypothetical protein